MAVVPTVEIPVYRVDPADESFTPELVVELTRCDSSVRPTHASIPAWGIDTQRSRPLSTRTGLAGGLRTRDVAGARAVRDVFVAQLQQRLRHPLVWAVVDGTWVRVRSFEFNHAGSAVLKCAQLWTVPVVVPITEIKSRRLRLVLAEPSPPTRWDLWADSERDGAIAEWREQIDAL